MNAIIDLLFFIYIVLFLLSFSYSSKLRHLPTFISLLIFSIIFYVIGIYNFTIQNDHDRWPFITMFSWFYFLCSYYFLRKKFIKKNLREPIIERFGFNIETKEQMNPYDYTFTWVIITFVVILTYITQAVIVRNI